jgi:aspartate kinase
VVPNARKLEAITYDEMLELATSGAKVLHNRSVEMAKKYGVEMVVRSSLNESEGTVVKEVVKMEKMLITGVASDKNTARISVIGVEDKPGIAFKVFQKLAKNNINIDIILQSVGRDGTKDISFTVSQDDLQDALKVLEENKESLTIREIKHNVNVAKVAIVGAGMMSNPGVASQMFEALFDYGININMISTSEIRITVLIDEKDVDRATLAIHEKFSLGEL